MIMRVGTVVALLAGCDSGVSGSHDAGVSSDGDVSADAGPPCEIPPGRRIAYEEAVDGGHHVALLDMSDGQPGCSVRLTEEPLADLGALVWTADGRWVIFVDDDTIWLADVSGAAPGVTAIDDAQLLAASALSPDGRWLLFERDSDVYAVALGAGSTEPVRIDLPPGWNWASFWWSPDGSHLATLGAGGNPFTVVALIDMRGAAPGIPWQADVEDPGAGPAPISWSPDSTRIAVETMGGFQPAPVVVVEIPGGTTRTVEYVGGVDYQSYHREWSPDGTRLLVTVSETQPEGGGTRTRTIAAVPPTGTITAIAVGPPPELERESPIGWVAPRTLHFTGERSLGLGGLYVVDNDSTPEPARLISASVDVHAYLWSPDGSTVLVENGSGETWKFPREGSGSASACPPGMVIRSNAAGVSPTWSPDSASYLCFDYGNPVDLEILDATTGMRTPLPVDGQYGGHAWSHDSAMLAVFRPTGPLMLFDRATGQLRAVADAGTFAAWEPLGSP